MICDDIIISGSPVDVTSFDEIKLRSDMMVVHNAGLSINRTITGNMVATVSNLKKDILNGVVAFVIHSRQSYEMTDYSHSNRVMLSTIARGYNVKLKVFKNVFGRMVVELKTTNDEISDMKDELLDMKDDPSITIDVSKLSRSQLSALKYHAKKHDIQISVRKGNIISKKSKDELKHDHMSPRACLFSWISATFGVSQGESHIIPDDLFDMFTSVSHLQTALSQHSRMWSYDTGTNVLTSINVRMKHIGGVTVVERWTPSHGKQPVFTSLRVTPAKLRKMKPYEVEFVIFNKECEKHGVDIKDLL